MRGGLCDEGAAAGSPLVAFPDGINDETHEGSQNTEKEEDRNHDSHADSPGEPAVIFGKVFTAKRTSEGQRSGKG